MKTVLVLFSIVIVFTNCSNPRYAYSPTAHNVPILAKQGDSKLAAYYSNNGILSNSDDNGTEYDRNSSAGADVQGAIAVTNHIGVQANYYLRSEKTNSTNGSYNYENSSIKYKRNLFEFGAGYFTKFDERERLLFQVYAGVGFGKTKINETGIDYNQDDFTRYYNTNLTKFFLEPSITFRTPKEIFAASIATRVSLIKFGKIQTNYLPDEKLDFNLDSLDRFGVGFLEPSFVGSFGFPKLPGLRVEMQVGLSVLFNESFIDYRPFNFSLGLVFDIRKMMKGPVEEPSRSRSRH